MGTTTLYGIRYSPWTERARWALDHHRIAHRYVEHVPLVGELALRVRSPGGGKASVPLLVEADGTRTPDSFAIMRRADAIGGGPSLRADDPEVALWHARLEPCVEAVRMRVTRRTLHDPAALDEAAATAIPVLGGPLLRPVAVIGARFIARKYGFDADAPATEEALVREALEALRAALGGAPHLIGGELSAADLFAASLLQGVQPVEDRFLPLGPATRRVWRDEALASSFPDLIAWRDALYAAHRHPAG